MKMRRSNIIRVKVPDELRRKMRRVKVDWDEYISSAIKEKLEEQRMKDASARLDEIRMRSKAVTTEELVEWIRKDRER